jgi:hypothetical protein
VLRAGRKEQSPIGAALRHHVLELLIPHCLIFFLVLDDRTARPPWQKKSQKNTAFSRVKSE